ncbi:MAG: FHA domain-containing protein, partial [Chloroflexota bacterium]
DFWSQLVVMLRITLLIALVIVVIVQLIYLSVVNATAGRIAQEQRRRQPDGPIMPTDPGEVDLSYSAENSGRRRGDLSPRDEGVIQPRMVVLNGLPNVSEIEIPADEFGIGRFYNPDHDILVALDERSISRRHAFFSKAGMGEYYLADTRSSYGTSIRRGEVFEPMTPGQEERLYNGDVVQFGSVVTVRFMLPGDTRAYATQV